MLEHALAFALRGWRVFPCNPKTKAPLLGIRADVKGDEGWKTQATTDTKVIANWWKRWPRALIGVPQGFNTGAFVVDLDVGGEHTRDGLRAALEAHLGASLPPTWEVQTAGGGTHLYFALPLLTPGDGRSPRHIPITNRRGALPPKKDLPVDIRGEGGYVIVPPSRRFDGMTYTWVQAPDAIPLAPAPQELIDCLLRQGRFAQKAPKPPAPPERARERAGDPAAERYASAALRKQVRQLEASPPGSRNDDLFRAAVCMGQFVAAGVLDERKVVEALEQVARGWPSLRKSQSTIQRGIKAGLTQPRDLTDVGRKRAPEPPPASGEEEYGESRPARPSVIITVTSLDPTPPVAAGQRDPELDRELAGLDLTDLGNARRFARRNRGRILWSQKLDWLWWDGCRWSREGAESVVLRAVHEVVDGLKHEANAIENDPTAT